MNDETAGAGTIIRSASPGAAADSAPPGELAGLLAALRFAADKHRDQRRKGACASPYINHPIEVAELLARVGCVTDPVLLQAAVLHDTLEDTKTTARELDERFGSEVRRLVEEVTDDKTLDKDERKRLQIEHAPSLSAAARHIKLADKICNVRDVCTKPPTAWSLERRADYLAWAEKVVAGCRGVSRTLEREFDRALAECRAVIGSAY